MRLWTIALAAAAAAAMACSTTGSQSAENNGPSMVPMDAAVSQNNGKPPPVAATPREGNAPANQAENQPGSGVGATAPGQPTGNSVSAGTNSGGLPEGTQAEGTTPGSGTGASASTGSAGSSSSTGSSSTAQGGVKAHSVDQVVSGKISKVSGNELTVSTDGGTDRTLQLVPQTMVTVDGNQATTGDLKEGQQVRASFDVVGGQDVAVEIQAGKNAQNQTGANFQGAPGAGGWPEPMTGAGKINGGSGNVNDQLKPGSEPQRH